MQDSSPNQEAKEDSSHKSDNDPLGLLDQLFDEEQLCNIANYFFHGNINTTEIEKNLNYPEKEDTNFDETVKIHFILQGTGKEVEPRVNIIEFIEKLDDRLRRINTETIRNHVETQGEVRGRINWQRTLSRRYQENPNDKTLFVCDNPEINYGTDENLVLKKVIWLINEILQKHKNLFEDPPENSDWSEFYSNNSEKGRTKIEELQNILKKNSYIERMQDGRKIKITDRMLEKAKQSRKVIYREAAKIYEAYENRLNEKSLKSILEQTLVEPDRKDDEKRIEKRSILYELFVLFKIINFFDENEDLPLKRKRIVKRKYRDTVAEISKEAENGKLLIYYDLSKCGSVKFQGFKKSEKVKKALRDGKEPYKEIFEDEEIQSSHDLLRSSKNFSEDMANYLTDKNFNASKKRPDIVIVDENKLEKGKENGVLIIEVKYSDDYEDYLLTGVKELIEYIVVASKENEPVFEKVKDLKKENGDKLTDGKDIAGILAVQENKNKVMKKDVKDLKVLEYSDIDEEGKISEIIEDKFL